MLARRFVRVADYDDGTLSWQVSLGILDFPMSFLLNPIGKLRWGFEDGRDGGSGLRL